ncbi:MAG: AAA family ATPase, partial [Streptosporangiaceae bacterium]
ALGTENQGVLVVIDNASAAADVRPLLTGNGPSRALVTSRDTPAGLGARLIELDVLSADAAVELLRRQLQLARGSEDTRIARQLDDARTVVGHCAGLPLALEIVAAMLAADPRLSLGGVAGYLADAHTRLDELRYGDAAVRAAFDLSYRKLDPDSARLFRLLTLNAGPEVGTEAAAAAAGQEQRPVRRMLDGLAQAHLVERGGAEGRWRLHDLVRLYAAEQGLALGAQDQRDSALHRLLGHYLAGAQAADVYLRLQPGEDMPGRFASVTEALDWLDIERENLVSSVGAAAAAEQPATAVALARALREFLELRRGHDEAIEVSRTAVAAAARIGDADAEAQAVAALSSALWLGRQFTAALTLLLRSDAPVGGVLLTGMPGIGKTTTATAAVRACAASFTEVRWHTATSRDTEASLAASLALRLQPGDDARKPLLVLDSAELLLADGEWRQPQVGALVAALVRPDATSRILLISDQQLSGLGSSMPRFTLPMLDRPAADQLVTRARQQRAHGDDEVPQGYQWLICRGHPRLLEYSSSVPAPEAVARLKEMDGAWEVTSPGLSRTSLAPRHPGSRITAWAAHRTAGLPQHVLLAFAFLAIAEPPDRSADLIEPAWHLMCGELGVPEVPLPTAVSPLARLGLVEPSPRDVYLMHPAIARAGRDLGLPVGRFTPLLLAAMWRARYEQLAKHGDQPQVQAHCAASQVPYLMRQLRWEDASAQCERAYHHDRSEDMAGRLLPLSNEIVRATLGTEIELITRVVREHIVLILAPEQGLARLEELYQRALAERNSAAAVATASTIAITLASKDPDRARDWLARSLAADAREQLGPWVTLMLRSVRAGLRFVSREDGEALAEALDVRRGIADLQAAQVEPSGVNLAGLRLDTLQVATAAAANLGRYAEAEQLGRELLRASYAAGAQSVAAKAHSSLASVLGSRMEPDQAEASVHLLAAAALEMQMAGGILAIVPPPQALKALVLVTMCLARQPELVPRTLAELQTRLDSAAGVDLTRLLAGLDRIPVSVSADGQVIFHFAPPVGSDGASAPPSGDAVSDVLAWAQHRPRPAEIIDVAGYPYHWQPFVDLATAVRNGDVSAANTLRTSLDDVRGTGWRSLADALAEIAHGSTPEIGGLDDTERAVVEWTLRRAAEPV